MDINFTIPYTAHFDLDQAEEDFRELLWWHPEKCVDSAIYDAVEENLEWPNNQHEYPNEVVEIAAKTLRARVGGVQLKLDFDNYNIVSSVYWFPHHAEL